MSYYSSFEIFRKVRRGRCPHRPIGQLRICRKSPKKNGAFCRVDVGIDPYTETGSACVCAAAFRKISCTLPGGPSRPPIRSRTISIVIGLF